MKERLRHAIDSLPDNGIGVHGTNLKSARQIEADGFLPDTVTFFVHQSKNIPDPLVYLKHIRKNKYHLDKALGRAHHIADKYFNANDDSGIPALVVFIPPRPPLSNRNAIPVVERDWESITNASVIGTIPLSQSENEWAAFKKVVSLLVDKEIINSGGLRQLPKE